MSIHPDMEKWKRRFSACLVLATVALLLTGAREVTEDLRSRPGSGARQSAALQDCGTAILAEAVCGELGDQSLSPESARLLVQACSRPVAPDDTRETASQ